MLEATQTGSEYCDVVNEVIDEIGKVILGKRDVIEAVLIAFLAGGHVLIEDVPGTGKTTLALALSRVTGLSYKRAQFTPDVMASDITGFTMYNKATDSFEYRPGLVMCNILLADEINRTSPKTQSALLEAMEEYNVTVDGVTHQIPNPFIVIATQNQQGYVGTFPLPEAQLDRFLIKVRIGYPSAAEEVDIISQRKLFNPLAAVRQLLDADVIPRIKRVVREVHIEPAVYAYIVDLIRATRTHTQVALGCSPRASLSLMRAAQAKAFVSGRDYVIPADAATLFPYVAAHRLGLSQEAKLHRFTADKVVADVLASVRVPFSGSGAKR